jgi:hypothetical protein
MRENLALPLILAAVFTAGCILIQRLDHDAECVEDVLTSAFLILAGLATIALLGRYADGAHAFRSPLPRQVQTLEAPPVPPRLGLTGIDWSPRSLRPPWC